MRISADTYLSQVNNGNTVRRCFHRMQQLLALLVIPAVFWCLKLTGITMAGEAFCGMEEHVHSEACVLQELVCGLEEAPSHTHTEECLSKVLICTLSEQEGHIHSDACRGRRQICMLEESEGHSHGESCYTKNWLCTIPEEAGHAHGEACFAFTFGCELEESQAHSHDESCLVAELVCGLPESSGHSHSGDCYTEILTCQQEETDGHTHSDSCYVTEEGYHCGLEEQQAHVHTEACFLVEKGKYVCGLEETQGHSHTEQCYRILDSCPIEEHIHVAGCYSDLTADLETSDDWEGSLADLIRSSSTVENVLIVARSQLGVMESTRNFQVDEFGVRRGITRYGQWYGNPYGDWSAMFVSFCLEYGGVRDYSLSSGPETLRQTWEEADLYRNAGEWTPQTGNLVFLRPYENETTEEASETVDAMPVSTAETAAAVAILSEITEEGMTVIQGDFQDAVAERVLEHNDPAILGYGLIPETASYGLVPRAGTTVQLAQTIDYSPGIFTEGRSFVLYARYNGQYFAIVSRPASGMEATVDAVAIEIDEQGRIYTDIENPNSLLWTFASDGSNYQIQNVDTGRYLHPGGDYGVLYDGNWPTALQTSGTGARFVHTSNNNNVGIYFNGEAKRFEVVRNKADASTLYFGYAAVPEACTIWLDGTDGGLGHLTGSPDTSYQVSVGETIQLPMEWTSPSKYSYRLRGWYDITNSVYYPAGAEMTVTGSAVLYADWVASTYDIGQFNAHVADTVSTNAIITTHMFDYNYLFNIHSTAANKTVSRSDHSETWSMVTSGKVAHGDQETFDFIFVDNDSGGLLCIPNNRSSHNVYPGSGIVTPEIYTDDLGTWLFATDNGFDPETGNGILGKTYLGTGDHLFQIMNDPNDEHYGYYYYDSRLNAASYNQSNQRFYVYEYLEGTSDAIGSTNSDFLPLNSPYANTNGKTVGTYYYSGVDGEYQDVPHYRYDSKYDSGNYNSVNNVQTDYAYGMRTDITFYLPKEPGTGGNKDLYGNDMQFQFSGDDDLWILIDGQLVLDIGGIHGAEEGVIDFSTGQVTVQGQQQTSLMELGIGAGDHTLSVLYLERGSSMSNCSIYFNLAPRFGLELKKEDVLTQELLNGTQFTVYEDLNCTETANLWADEEAYFADQADGVLDEYQSTFTVTNGTAKMWGLGSGNTYYIKETGAPDAEGYGAANGLIRLTIEKDGQATYHVDVIADGEGNGPSNGFTVHGVKIDEESKTVYLVATNAPESVVDVTTVQVLKKWEDTKDHSGDYIQAYLTVTDPDGTVRRIREVTLSDENDWQYLWTNLPKYDYEALTEVKYGIEESYESGYYSTVRQITQIEISTTKWAEATSFLDGESYILKHTNGYLSTTSATDAKLKWVEEATAQSSELATWKATVSNGKVKFTNGAGQILTFNYSTYNSSNRYFYATTGIADYQSFTPVGVSSGFCFYATRSYRNYYLASSGINSSGRIAATTDSNDGLILMPMKKMTQTDVQPVKDWAYQITNTPLDANNETSLAVQKNWVIPPGHSADLYQEFAVTVRLLANGVNTGRSVTLTLKNDWRGEFLGLPYKDTDGNVIAYTVEEVWSKDRWTTFYGEITASGSSPPTYSTVITNTYYAGGPELPSTGTAARLLHILCGGGIMLSSLVYGIVLRRKRERRMKQAF